MPRRPDRHRRYCWYRYGAAEIAEAAGVSVRSVHSASWRGELDPADLGSVAAFIVRRRGDLRLLVGAKSVRGLERPGESRGGARLSGG